MYDLLIGHLNVSTCVNKQGLINCLSPEALIHFVMTKDREVHFPEKEEEKGKEEEERGGKNEKEERPEHVRGDLGLKEDEMKHKLLASGDLDEEAWLAYLIAEALKSS